MLSSLNSLDTEEKGKLIIAFGRLQGHVLRLSLSLFCLSNWYSKFIAWFSLKLQSTHEMRWTWYVISISHVISYLHSAESAVKTGKVYINLDLHQG